MHLSPEQASETLGTGSLLLSTLKVAVFDVRIGDQTGRQHFLKVLVAQHNGIGIG